MWGITSKHVIAGLGVVLGLVVAAGLFLSNSGYGFRAPLVAYAGREAVLDMPEDLVGNGLPDAHALELVRQVGCAEAYSAIWGATPNAFELNSLMLQHEPDVQLPESQQVLLATLLLLDDATQEALISHIAEKDMPLIGEYVVVHCLDEDHCAPALGDAHPQWEQYRELEADVDGFMQPYSPKGINAGDSESNLAHFEQDVAFQVALASQKASQQDSAQHTKQDFIGISSIEELQRIGNDPDYPLDRLYALTQDIDASDTANWNDGKGFDPIGRRYFDDIQLMFTGTLDGRGYVILSLTINRPEENHIGPFGAIGPGGVVMNLGLEGSVVIGNDFVGGLVGWNEGTISESYATGTVTGDWDAGGLVGYNSTGTVSKSYATGAVTGGSYLGGLVGSNWHGMVSESYATGAVTGYLVVGGLVGNNNLGVITKSYATGAVTGSAGVGFLKTGTVGGVGGLVGRNSNGTVSTSYAIGVVEGNWFVGGLVGYNRGDAVLNSYATGAVTGNRVVGGLVERNDGTVSTSYATGMVTGNRSVGGLVGRNLFNDSWVMARVTASFWDIETSGIDVSLGEWFFGCRPRQRQTDLKGLPTAAMQSLRTYADAGWDFEEVWGINDGESYPFLLAIPNIVGGEDEGKDKLQPVSGVQHPAKFAFTGNMFILLGLVVVLLIKPYYRVVSST